jgi:hypothetical protein
MPSNKIEARGVELIAEERHRQENQEGFTDELDDFYHLGELARAASVYAFPPDRPIDIKRHWPWDRDWWKPEAHYISRVDAPPKEWIQARIRVLAKAGALLAAEIDRLQRKLKNM